MTFFRFVSVSAIVLVAIQAASAQNKFPLRPGEWESELSVPGNHGPPVKTLFCLNDALWEKALTQNPICTIRLLNLSAGGANYTMDCETKAFQMKGNVNLVFDGMEHMIGNGKIDITMSGKTSSSSSHIDYRWKAAACSANDANLKPQRKP